MKVLVGALLTAAVLLGTAHSLQCYTCTAVTNNADCRTTTTCSTEESYCFKIHSTVGEITSIFKGCEATCTEVSTSVRGISTSTNCCSTDLCNGATSARVSYAMLTLAAGACALLLKAGL
ncbi:toxin S6C6-like isoform X2 [Ambystoma mexicanum]|uniref:toxin S6C6-like isoform X1 n=1 Tax=Ambystoma mexicanum TaxID=8296 RepID=UPI0037E8EF04